jgi:hypothetical protein
MGNFFRNIIKGVYKVTQSIITTINIITGRVEKIKSEEVVEVIREEERYSEVKPKIVKYPENQIVREEDMIGTHRNISKKYEVVFEVDMIDLETKTPETRYLSLLVDRMKTIAGLKRDFVDQWSEYYTALNKKIINIKLDSIYKKIE